MFLLQIIKQRVNTNNMIIEIHFFTDGRGMLLKRKKKGDISVCYITKITT